MRVGMLFRHSEKTALVVSRPKTGNGLSSPVGVLGDHTPESRVVLVTSEKRQNEKHWLSHIATRRTQTIGDAFIYQKIESFLSLSLSLSAPSVYLLSNALSISVLSRTRPLEIYTRFPRLTRFARVIITITIIICSVGFACVCSRARH